jgi:predicted ATP-dependent protease
MAAKYELTKNELSWRCDLSYLPFTCTADMTPLEDFIGQERAMRAIEFGLGVNKPGFNIFVTGLTGTGKTSIIQAFLKKVNQHGTPVEDSEQPPDWCYLYNFADPDRPRVLRIRRGWGKSLKADMERLVQSLQRDAKKMFESDEFAGHRQAMIEELQKRQQQMMETLMAEANSGGFALRMTPSGIALLPIKDGKPMEEAAFLALSPLEKKQLEEKRADIEKRVEETLRAGKKLEREISERLEELERQAGEYLVRLPFADLEEKYADHAAILTYLAEVRVHVLNNLQKFRGVDLPVTPIPLAIAAEPLADPFLPYRVNVFVDNGGTQGPPIVVETNPNYHNLFGVVEKKPTVGGYTTDFTLIKAGSISRANGGYLVL